jgi:hypothetical protein
MAPVRSALDEGNPRGAIAALNEELEVKGDKELPADINGDKALFVLDRASIQQSLAQFPLSEQDFQAADKAIDMLDLAHNAGDSIGEYVFNGSSGKYVAPPYEKLLINTLNMVNYLEQQDLNGARIEARRMSVMQRYLKEQLHEGDNAVIGLGGFLAGLTFEKSGEVDEALRYYDEALAFGGNTRALAEPVRLLAQRGSYTSPRLKALNEGEAPAPPPEDTGEIVLVAGYGRVPHKIAERVPIGLALTWVSGALSPHDVAMANSLAAQGLVTWVNFPTLGEEQGGYSLPACTIDGRPVAVDEAVNVSAEVRKEWKKIEGKIIVSAITRMVARAAAGMAAGAAGKAASGEGWVGLLLSLGTQATLTALDTPDTRSWETLPARVAVSRVRVPVGLHKVVLRGRGVSREQEVNIEKGGWALVSLMALR